MPQQDNIYYEKYMELLRDTSQDDIIPALRNDIFQFLMVVDQDAAFASAFAQIDNGRHSEDIMKVSTSILSSTSKIRAMLNALNDYDKNSG